MNLDKEGKFKYNQLKRVISPKQSCNVNSICCAYETKMQSEYCWDNVKSYHKEYNSPADKFMYYLRNEPIIRELYKTINNTQYEKWIKDTTKDEFLYSDNSIPPNEVLKILAIGFNLFINMNNGENYKNACEYKQLSIQDIRGCLYTRKPIVSSFNLNGYGHIMTIIGFDINNFYVYDSYGMSYLKNHKREGKSIIIPKDEFEKICKPIDNKNKYCIIF